eukprot:3939866-Rhodomonas_salina.1
MFLHYSPTNPILLPYRPTHPYALSGTGIAYAPALSSYVACAICSYPIFLRTPYATSSTDIALRYYTGMLSYYAMWGTELGYGATLLREGEREGGKEGRREGGKERERVKGVSTALERLALLLSEYRLCYYAISGTEPGYAATRLAPTEAYAVAHRLCHRDDGSAFLPAYALLRY